MALYEPGKRFSFQQLHHDEPRIAVLFQILDPDDVGVGKAHGAGRFPGQHRDRIGVMGERMAQDLNRYLAVAGTGAFKVLVHRPVDIAHAARGNQCLDAVAPLETLVQAGMAVGGAREGMLLRPGLVRAGLNPCCVHAGIPFLDSSERERV